MLHSKWKSAAALTLFIVSVGFTACRTPQAAPLRVGEGRRGHLELPDLGANVTYQWAQSLAGGGPTVRIENPDSRVASFVAPEATSDYVLSFVRMARIDGRTVKSEMLDVEIIASNAIPEADAGQSRTVHEGELVTLFGVGRDVEGQELSYRWLQTKGPTIDLSDADVASPTFRAPDVPELTYLIFELRVEDGERTSLPDEVSIGVEPINAVPVADAGADQSVLEGQRVTLDGLGRDDDEDSTITYRWLVVTPNPVVTLDDANARQPQFVAPMCARGVESYRLEFELRVHDGRIESEGESVVVIVNAINDPPEARAASPISAMEEGEVTLQGSGNDPEEKELTYSWRQVSGPKVRIRNADRSEASFKAPVVPDGEAALSLEFELIASDGVHASVPARVTATILPKHPPLSPLARDEVEHLFGETPRGFLTRWDDVELSPAGSEKGLFGNPVNRSLTVSARTDSQHLACELPPGSWRLIGSIDLREVEQEGEGPWGGALRFETGGGKAVALGVVSYGREIGIQIRELERSGRTGGWEPIRQTLRVLQPWPTRKPLHFAVTWQDSLLRVQWSDAEASVLDRPERRVELASSPAALSALVERALTAFGDLRLVGL